MPVIDFESESLVSLRQARSHFPQAPSYNTVVRWTNAGVNGVVLESAYIAGSKLTSLEAILRFKRACNGGGK